MPFNNLMPMFSPDTWPLSVSVRMRKTKQSPPPTPTAAAQAGAFPQMDAVCSLERSPSLSPFFPSFLPHLSLISTYLASDTHTSIPSIFTWNLR